MSCPAFANLTAKTAFLGYKSCGFGVPGILYKRYVTEAKVLVFADNLVALRAYIKNINAVIAGDGALVKNVFFGSVVPVFIKILGLIRAVLTLKEVYAGFLALIRDG